jgi:indolepyruvate ferredoxin oxidoreductase beta subunit
MKAGQMAEDMGNIKVMNVILLGSLVKAMGLTDINWEEIIEQNVKPQFVDLNIKALKAGMDAV